MPNKYVNNKNFIEELRLFEKINPNRKTVKTVSNCMKRAKGSPTIANSKIKAAKIENTTKLSSIKSRRKSSFIYKQSINLFINKPSISKKGTHMYNFSHNGQITRSKIKQKLGSPKHSNKFISFMNQFKKQKKLPKSGKLFSGFLNKARSSQKHETKGSDNNGSFGMKTTTEQGKKLITQFDKVKVIKDIIAVDKLGLDNLEILFKNEENLYTFLELIHQKRDIYDLFKNYIDFAQSNDFQELIDLICIEELQTAVKNSLIIERMGLMSCFYIFINESYKEENIFLKKLISLIYGSFHSFLSTIIGSIRDSPLLDVC